MWGPIHRLVGCQSLFIAFRNHPNVGRLCFFASTRLTVDRYQHADGQVLKGQSP